MRRRPLRPLPRRALHLQLAQRFRRDVFFKFQKQTCFGIGFDLTCPHFGFAFKK
jgi:hypothetical protein